MWEIVTVSLKTPACQKECVGSWGEVESRRGQRVASEGRKGLGVLMLPVFSNGQ